MYKTYTNKCVKFARSSTFDIISSRKFTVEQAISTSFRHLLDIQNFSHISTWDIISSLLYVELAIENFQQSIVRP